MKVCLIVILYRLSVKFLLAPGQKTALHWPDLKISHSVFSSIHFSVFITGSLYMPPVDLYLISEKSIWKNQVRLTGFLVYFELDFTAGVV
jgi:hypothetical protein